MRVIASFRDGILRQRKPTTMEQPIRLVLATDRLVTMAKDLCRAHCSEAIFTEIRALAKAYIDDAEEWKRAAVEFRSPATSRPEIIETARRLMTVKMANRKLAVKVHELADSYLLIASVNDRLIMQSKKTTQLQSPS
jgi:hypothetical protein